MSQGSLNPKIRSLGQKVWPVARAQTHTRTDRVTTEGTLSGFQDFFLQPIIKDRPNYHLKEENSSNNVSCSKCSHTQNIPGYGMTNKEKSEYLFSLSTFSDDVILVWIK